AATTGTAQAWLAGAGQQAATAPAATAPDLCAREAPVGGAASTARDGLGADAQAAGSGAPSAAADATEPRVRDAVGRACRRIRGPACAGCDEPVALALPRRRGVGDRWQGHRPRVRCARSCVRTGAAHAAR